jgi:hypothetical protein
MSTVWQRKGETESLCSACARYGVNENDFLKASKNCCYETKYRSFFGNGYLIAKVADVKEFKVKVEREEKAKEQAFLDKYGKEGLAKMRQEAKEAKEAAARAKILKATIMVLVRESSSSSSDKLPSLEGIKIGKTAAKKEWYLNDNDMNSVIPTEIIGHRKNYSTADIIRKAHSKHYSNELIKKLGDSKTKKMQYASCLRVIVNQELDGMEATVATKLISDAKHDLQNAKTKITGDAEAAKDKMKTTRAKSLGYLEKEEERLKALLKDTQDKKRAAPGELKDALAEVDNQTKEKLGEKDGMLKGLDTLFGARCDDDDDDDDDDTIDKENASSTKKQKTKA